MEKDRFLSLVKNFTSLTREETAELIALEPLFPYCQVIHHLCSRGAQNAGLNERDRLLATSAIYATERTVLKSLMSAPTVTRNVPAPEVPNDRAPLAAVIEKEVATPRVVEVPVVIRRDGASGDDLRKNVLVDLEALQQAKEKYEYTLDQLARNPGYIAPEESKKKIKTTSDGAGSSDVIIEEIKTKKKVKPEGPRQQEQIEIIENFIRTQPSIGRPKSGTTPAQDDLAEKSLEYGDQIVSETLVEILLKQGKKDKAIEVLKKLIWKIPQKKAYFAAQIEELKK